MKRFRDAATSISFGIPSCPRSFRVPPVFKGWTNWGQRIQSAESKYQQASSYLQLETVYVFPHQPYLQLRYYNGSFYQTKYNDSAFAALLLDDLHLITPLKLLPDWRGVIEPINESLFLSRHPVIYHHDDFIIDVQYISKYIPMPDFSYVDKYKFISFIRAVWRDNLKRSREHRRLDKVKVALEAAAGVYGSNRNGMKVDEQLHWKLKRTVLLVYFEPSGDQEYFLLNTVCYAKHYGLKLVIYVNNNKYRNLSEHTNSWITLYPDVYMIDYPYELLWRNLLEQDSEFYHGSHTQYLRTYLMNDIPSIKEYCDLMKFVIVAEVLSFDFDVLYIDTDLVFLTDPIPHLMRGNADIAMAVEMRHPKFPTLFFLHQGLKDGWKYVEANAGIMRIRSTLNGKNAMAKWIAISLAKCLFHKTCTCCQKVFRSLVDTLR